MFPCGFTEDVYIAGEGKCKAFWEAAMSTEIGKVLAGARMEYIGLGLLVSWVYCSWFSPALFGAQQSVTHDDASWLISMATCVATIFTASRLLGSRALSLKRGSYAAAAVLVCVGTLCLGDFGPHEGAPALLLVGSLITGFSSGLLYVLWSEYMATRRSGEIRAAAFTVSLVALCALLVAWALPVGASTFFVSALPLLSVPPFRRATQSIRVAAGRAEGPEGESAPEDRSSWALAVRVFGVSVALSALAAFGWASAAALPGVHPSWAIFGGAFGGIALTLVVALVSSLARLSPNIASLYRLLIPVMVIAFALLEIRPEPWGDLAMGLLLALGMGFDFFLLMYFGSLFASRLPNALRAFCYCEGFTNAGLFLGNAAGILCGRVLSAPPYVLENIYLGLIVVTVLVLIVMVEQQGAIDRMMAVGDHSAIVARIAEAHGLTVREREILDYLARGRSVPFISEALFIQKSTVETHRKHIYTKLGIHNRQELLDLMDRSVL